MQSRALFAGLTIVAGAAIVAGVAACKSARSTRAGSDTGGSATVVPSTPGPMPVAVPASTATDCGGPLFIDAPRPWTDVVLKPGSLDELRAAIDASDRAKPTRITLKPGRYTGRCLFVEDHLRTESAPLWIRGEGQVQIDCVDGNGQAIGLQHSSYIALDGLTVGPEKGAYGDSAVHIAGIPKNPKSRAPRDYGEHEPSHHIVVRRLTARNLYRPRDGDEKPLAFESGCCDAVKANQAEWVWVVDSVVSRTARHGFDNVGVHHAFYCNNVLSDMVGAGFAMEAKGGSSEVVFERNRVERVRHRGIVLGGEGTDNVFMWPWNASYEGRDIVARNNVVVDAAEGGLGFYGCQGCAAVDNTVWFTAGFQTFVDGKLASSPHDMLRMYASTIEGQADDERSGWKPRREGEKLANRDNRVVGNLFGAVAGDMTCALDAGDAATTGLVMHHNVWWNGGKALPTTCETGDVATRWPDGASKFGGVDPRVGADLRPLAGSPLLGAGVLDRASARVDATGRPRLAAPSIGALVP